MRKCLSLFSVFCVFATAIAASRADDQADAKAIVAKAIKAAGGEEKLTKFNAHTVKETGTYYGMGDGVPYTGIYAIQYPHQFKMEIEGFFKMVLNGDKGWRQINGETVEMTPDQLKIQQDDHYGGWVTTLLPLKDKKFKLATAGETKVADRTALGVRVSSDKHRDVTLYFDKQTGLLAKAEFRVISEEQGGKEVNREILFSEYKEIEGAKMATKFLIKHDGEKFVEAEAIEFRPVGKLDDNVFAKP